MTPQEIAAGLTGMEYGNEPGKELCKAAKAAGVVILYGASDDLIEIRGAVDDEVGAYSGGRVHFDTKGLLPARHSIEDDDILRDYLLRALHMVPVDALWAQEDEYSWTYRTDIPHATFEIVEDNAPYCRGIVFSLADAVTTKSPS